MRWRRGRGRSEIEDRRWGGGGGGFGGAGFPVGRAGAGLGGLGLLGVVLLLVLNALSGGKGGVGVNPGLDPFPAIPGPRSGPLPGAPYPDARLKDFVGFVVDDVQDAWTKLFQQAGRTYRRTKIVLFTGQTYSGCGTASSETGPFYCPADHKVYLDLGFFTELRNRFRAPGDFAEAYVIAHEFGHHVQSLLGVEDQVERDRREDPSQASDLSVRLELQADCLAGVWAHSAYQQDLLERGDLEEGQTAAAAVGDDRIQRETQGRITPETFTHGTSAQRVHWLTEGFQSGDPGSCDTFAGDV